MQAFLALHFLRNATVTVLLSQQKVSPASETKLGKAPKDVEYVGESLPIKSTLLECTKLHCPSVYSKLLDQKHFLCSFICVLCRSESTAVVMLSQAQQPRLDVYEI